MVQDGFDGFDFLFEEVDGFLVDAVEWVFVDATVLFGVLVSQPLLPAFSLFQAIMQLKAVREGGTCQLVVVIPI